MEESILQMLGRKNYVPADAHELLKRLKLDPSQKQELRSILADLERDGFVARIKGHRYILPKEADLIPGRIQITKGGRGFLMPDDPAMAEIAISARNTGTAMNEDRVLVRLDVKPQGRLPKAETSHAGKVVRVLERRRSQMVGTFRQGKQFAHVVPDDPRMNHDIYVPPAKDVGLKPREGDKVVVELGEWESRHTNPDGVIIEVLGPPTAEGVDMLGVIRQYDLPLRFPKDVLNEVRSFGTEVTDADLQGRKDCRSHDVITIDPFDARDFDDAIYLQRAGENQWRLWVHIADVSQYVKPNSALDREAHKRGNSTYLVDRVIPMLPEALSNELCSLKPDVDRLTKCVEFVLTDSGDVVRTRFHETVIHSKRRYSYEEAMEVIEKKRPGDRIEEMLHQANRLAQLIRKKRFAKGSLELDFPETKIHLTEKGAVDRIEKTENDQSHQLIEEFMLLANEAVATRLIQQKKATIHRVHESPDPQRLSDYREEILGHNLPCGNLEKTAEVQKLLRRLNKLTIGPALKIGFLKSLMQARYSVEALGHYGLAKEKYAHFTSPIRRYADLIVHRTLFQNFKIPVGKLARIADHISTTERNSSDAERDSKDVKMFAFLQKQIEERNLVPYDAHVTDVRNFGLFMDVPDLGMRGLIPLSRMDDDFYEFDSARVQVIGRRSKRVIGLGDVIEVIVDKVDRAKKEVDFRPAGSSPGRGRSSSSKERGGRGRPGNRSERGGGGNRSGDSRKKSGSRSRKSDKPKSRDGKPKSDRSKRSQQSKKRPSRPRSSSPKRSNQASSQKRSGGGGRRRK